ncbi:thioredoxin family protein [Spirosoma knui]
MSSFSRHCLRSAGVLLIVLFSTSVWAQGIKFFEGKWEDALALAKAENKLIYVDIYTTWCGPCRMMAQQVFPDRKAGKVFNGYFINYKVDAEKGEGVKLAASYGVRAYPTGLFINADAQLVHSFIGFKETGSFLEEGHDAFRRSGPGTILAEYEKAIKAGNRHPDVVRSFLKIRRRYGQDNTAYLEDYLKTLPTDSLKTPVTLKLVLESINSLDGKAVDVLLANRQDPRVPNRLITLYDDELAEATAERSKERLNRLAERIQSIEGPEQGTVTVTNYRMRYYQAMKQWQQFAEQAETYARQHLLPKLTPEAKEKTPDQFRDSYAQLCDLGWYFYHELKDEARLKTMLTWMQTAEQLAETPRGTGVCACLLYRTGDREQAVQLQNKAIALAQKAGDDVNSYLETLKRMEKGKSL